jgi:uncharacterized protein YciI
MQFLAISTIHGDVAPYLDGDFAVLERWQREGIVTAAWMKADSSGGVFILSADSQQDAEQALLQIPAVAHGVTDVSLTALLEVVDGR